MEKSCSPFMKKSLLTATERKRWNEFCRISFFVDALLFSGALKEPTTFLRQHISFLISNAVVD